MLGRIVGGLSKSLGVRIRQVIASAEAASSSSAVVVTYKIRDVLVFYSYTVHSLLVPVAITEAASTDEQGGAAGGSLAMSEGTGGDGDKEDEGGDGGAAAALGMGIDLGLDDTGVDEDEGVDGGELAVTLAQLCERVSNLLQTLLGKQADRFMGAPPQYPQDLSALREVLDAMEDIEVSCEQVGSERCVCALGCVGGEGYRGGSIRRCMCAELHAHKKEYT